MLLNKAIYVFLIVVLLMVSPIVNVCGCSGFADCQKAANQGDMRAQYNLAMMYGKGDGVKRNYEKAFDWLQRAANQGESMSQYGLSILYANGDGVQLNLIQSYKWAGIAFEHGHKDAKQIINTLTEHMSRSQIDQAKELTLNFKPAKEPPIAAISSNSPAISKQQTAKIQRYLKEAGYYTGDVDGLLGSQTTAAIKSFQRYEKICVTGAMDLKLLAQIDSKIGLNEKEIKVSDAPRAFSVIPPGTWIQGPIKVRSARLSLVSPPEAPFAACSVSIKEIPGLRDMPQATFDNGMVNDPPSASEMASQLSALYNNVKVFSSSTAFISGFPAQLYKLQYSSGSPEGELWNYGIMVTTAKGKNAIELDSEEQVAATLLKVKEAVQAGEFDELITRQIVKRHSK